jgi:orotate phosphoribosyltransferase
MNHRDRLRSLLIERSLFIGDFTLASGARSSYYIDARLTTMASEGQFLLGQVGFAAMHQHFPSARWIGGLTLGADPIAYAVAHRSWIEQAPVEAFTIRKAAKDHGTGRLIEGGIPSGESALVVEDTLTTGGSSLQAVRALENHGVKVLGIMAVVDREAGGRSRLEDAGYRVHALVTSGELLHAAGHEPAPG